MWELSTFLASLQSIDLKNQAKIPELFLEEDLQPWIGWIGYSVATYGRPPVDLRETQSKICNLEEKKINPTVDSRRFLP
jgi:hypothetical protein